MRRLEHDHAASFVLDTLTRAHEREPFVGGLFNAYEPAIHYELFNAALARGLDETLLEAPIGVGQKTCDLVFPLSGDDWLWVEVKMWWFFHQAFNAPYVMLGKTRGWPLVDWRRVERVPKGAQRAVLLITTWDDDAAKATADRWLDGLKPLMAKAGAPPQPLVRHLRARFYPGPKEHTRRGEILLWSSIHDPRLV